jgi:hypothetical protein
MTHKLLVALAGVAALIAGVPACSPGGGAASGGSPQSSVSAGANLQQWLDLARRYAQCARDHGHPNFPDPVIDNGEVVYPGDDVSKDEAAAIAQVPECKVLDEQLSALRSVATRPSYSAADIQKLKDFAKCLREHGVPEWPDPKSDGSFPITGTSLEAEGKSKRFLDAVQVCKQYWNQKVSTS